MGQGAVALDGSVLVLDAAADANLQISPSHTSEYLPPFSTVAVSENADVALIGNGDLWPSCWSDDGHLYAAWGDGSGFASNELTDIGVARIEGTPQEANLMGMNLAIGAAVGQVWTGARYTRKPTGIACVDGDLYLAVQDLELDFDDAPAATIARSRDKGVTWEWDRSEPMFSGHDLTTVFFLDQGKDGTAGLDAGKYVYAYALDGNWRDSFSNRVRDPTRLWLARVPRDALQDRSRWEWYASDHAQAPLWSTVASDRRPVPEDARRIYIRPTPYLGTNVSALSVVSQGGVVYDAPLKRYIYTSWTEYSFEFYEAPTPWGPFELFFRKDFGGYPWSLQKAGGYAATIPSKFISADGRGLYLQSNTWWGGANNYGFSLRQLQIEPYVKVPARNMAGADIDLRRSSAVAIGSSFHAGHPDFLSDGIRTGQSENSLTGEQRQVDFWGYTWPADYRMNRLTYTSGDTASGCGVFETMDVQVRHNGTWLPVKDLVISPSLSLDASSGSFATYSLRFAVEEGDGIRLQGNPSGDSGCTTIAELSVGFDG